jgi:spoIIIJ-associated protein
MPEASRSALKTLTDEILGKLGFSGTVSVEEPEPGRYGVSIELSSDQHFLIGQHGLNLGAFQHIVKLLSRKVLSPEETLSFVDVNRYFAEKREFLEREARKAAEETLSTGFSVTLKPMQAFERKIVHTVLASYEGVQSESIGKGEERRVLVRPRVEAAS